jgi:ABC-type lipoprotein export system ATPase subunit
MQAAPTTSASASAKAVARSGVLIEARDLRKSYGAGAAEITILSGINVGVEAGELIAIVGPSGAGKSTFLHLLAALDTPTSGTVYFEQKAIDSFRESELADYRNRSDRFCLATASPFG